MLVVEEAVCGLGVLNRLVARAAFSKRRFVDGDVGVHEVVVFGPEGEHGGGQAIPVVLHQRVAAVVVDAGAHVVAGVTGGEQAERAAHAEAGRADGATGQLLEVLHGPGRVLRRLFDVEGHEELARFVGLGRELAVVHVRREGDEAFSGEAVGDARDVGVQAPPLLEDDDALAAAARGLREIAAAGSAVRWKGHEFAHWDASGKSLK